MSNHETEDLPPFIAPEHFGTLDHIEKIDAHIASGRIPHDTYFRLRAVGVNELDWKHENRRLLFSLADDIAEHGATPERMRPDSMQLLWGERPKAIIDWEQYIHKEAYTQFDTMYYRLANLAAAIKRVRKDTGQTLQEVPPRWDYSLNESEWVRCVSLARPIWRVIVSRIRPDWLEQPKKFCPPTLGMTWVYELSERESRRRNVTAAVISDTVVYDIYDESVRIGVKGIGPAGRESLRELLTDEHQELETRSA